MILNRRSDKGTTGFRLDFEGTQRTSDKEMVRKKIPTSNWKKFSPSTSGVSEEDERTRIMGCATMWHESPDEMVEMINSIFRIDEDYSARYGNSGLPFESGCFGHFWYIHFLIPSKTS